MKKMFVLLLACVLAFLLVTPCFASATHVGETWTFGTYPTARVTSPVELAALRSLPTLKGTCYATLPDGSTLPYTDVICGGQKYRAIFPQSKNSTIEWYRFEPLTWTVVGDESGLQVLSCNTPITAMPGSTKCTDDVYKWLNTYFYETAFTKTEQSFIPDVSACYGSNNKTYVFLPAGTSFGFSAQNNDVTINAPDGINVKKNAPAKQAGANLTDSQNTVTLHPMIVYTTKTNIKPGWIISLLMAIFGH